MTSDPTQYPVAARLQLPVAKYNTDGYSFGQRVRSRIILWARHLGEDVLADPGTSVAAIGDGLVVWSEVRAGDEKHRNWGGIVIIGHRHRETNDPFYSLYGHITNLSVSVGQQVTAGQPIGIVAAGLTPENGWWRKPHLHFGIYAGPWMDQVLPGYARPFDGRTKYSWWRPPAKFIGEYGQA